jgi:membrane protein YqaA with SNARE-associated domain
LSFAEVTAAVLEFVRQHPTWAAAIVFVMAFGESLPLASLVLPFWTLLVAIGALIGAAAPLTFWTIVSAAAIGAALGDWLSYWIGYRYQGRVERVWPFRKTQGFARESARPVQTLGRWSRCLGPVFRTVARDRPNRCRRRGNAGTTLSIGELDLCVRLGLRAAFAGSMGPQHRPSMVSLSTWDA